MRSFAVMFAILALPSLGPAQDAEPAEDRPPDEEVTVIGRQALRRMALQVQRAQDEFYALFNALNDDDRFDISCDKEKVIGSLIATRICQPNHERDSFSQSAQMSFRGGVHDPVPEIVNGNRRLAAKMVELINANPELRKAVEDYAQARAAYLSAAGNSSAED